MRLHRSSILPAAVVVAFLALVALTALLPLYTDEVEGKIEFGRTLVEGGRVVSVLPECRASWIRSLPVSWAPAALYYHLFFSWVGLRGIKLSAVAMALLLVGGVGWALVRARRRKLVALRSLASYLALHAVGLVPLAMVTARSESTILLALLAWVGFALYSPIASCRTVRARALVTLGFVLVTSIAFMTHPKTLLFSPLILASIALTFTRRRPVWLAAAALFFGLGAAQTYVEGRAFVKCPESPKVENVITHQALDVGAALRDPALLVKNTAANLDLAADALALEPFPPWLPLRREMTLFERMANATGHAWLRGFLWGSPVFVAVACAASWRRRAARKRAILAAAVASSALAHVALSLAWPFYNSALLVCVLALAVALAASAARIGARAELRARVAPLAVRARPFAWAAAIAAMTATLLAYAPGILRVARHDGTSLADMPAWTPVFGYSTEREKIRAHAARCGIHDGARRLVVDDATFFAFDGLREQLPLIYVSDATAMWGLDRPGVEDVIFLADLGAPGIIAREAYFPTWLAPKALREGDYLCVPEVIGFLHAVEPGARVDLGKDGASADMLLDGWSFQEERGRWTTGEDAAFVFAYRGPLPHTTSLHFELYAPLLGPRHDQDVDVVLNGTRIGTIHVGEADNDVALDRRLAAPPGVFHAVNRVVLRPRDRRSPQELGAAPEPRTLGIFVHAFWFD